MNKFKRTKKSYTSSALLSGCSMIHYKDNQIIKIPEKKWQIFASKLKINELEKYGQEFYCKFKKSLYMKWLDPKNNPLPKEGEIIAYIDNKVTTGWMEDELFVDSLHFEEDFSGDNTRYIKKEIIAYMPLPPCPKLEKNNEHPELICLFCENTDFMEKKIPFPTEKGIIMSEAFVCNQCGEPLMNSEQMDNFIKLSKIE